MLILGPFSSYFYYLLPRENRLKINITPYGEKLYYLTYRDKI